MAGDGGGRLARALGRAGRGGAAAHQGCGRSPGHNKLAEREVKNTAGGSVGWARSGMPIDLSTRRRPTFFFFFFFLLELHPPSKSGPEPSLCILLHPPGDPK